MKNDIKDKIEDFTSTNSYVPLSPSDLMYTLDINENDAGNFYFALGELEKEGIVSLTKKGKIVSIRQSGKLIGLYRGTTRGFGFVTPENAPKSLKGDIFISKEKSHGALDGDRVIVCMLSGKYTYRDGESPDGEIERILERKNKTLICKYEKRKISTVRRARKAPMNYYAIPTNNKIPIKIAVRAGNDMRAENGDIVEVEITKYPVQNANAEGKIIKIFGNSKSREANYKAILANNDIRTDFPDEVLAEAEAKSTEPINYNGREDFREKIIFTIDGADAKDLDDAISLDVTADGYVLGVHIADVSNYVVENSELDREAYLRGTSVYFTDKVVPMLPKALSNGICSLNGGEERYALSALVTLDKKGNILQTNIKESVIKSNVRGVYSEINDVIEKKEKSEFFAKYEKVADTLFDMINLYHILQRKSEEHGALELESSEAQIILDENGTPTDIQKRERGEGEKMIEQFMLCANEAVASWLRWQSMPCVYRIHEEPNPEKMQAFSVFAHNLGINISPLQKKQIFSSSLQKIMYDANEKSLSSVVSNVLLRSLAKAKYSSEPSGHFGLGIDLYCHFTSPIRRYPDLSVHRIVKAVLHGKAIDEYLDKLTLFAADSARMSSENELKALYAERDIEDLYKTLYMSDKKGEEYDAIINSVTSFGIFAELDNTCEGLIPIESLSGYYDYDDKNYTLTKGTKVYRLGQKIRVIIENVDIERRKTEMRIAE